MSTEAEILTLKLEMLTNTVRRLRDLKKLAAKPNFQDYVFAWADKSLGVKGGLFDGTKPSTVGVENATVFNNKPKNLSFRNGMDEPAVFMLRHDAIKAAILNTEGVLFHMIEAFDAKKESDAG
jgi:hypothetical protein